MWQEDSTVNQYIATDMEIALIQYYIILEFHIDKGMRNQQDVTFHKLAIV